MNRRVQYEAGAQKAILRLPLDAQQHIRAKLLELERGHTEGLDIKKLRGRRNEWRLRVGDYRIVYRPPSAEGIIWILRVEQRSDAYRW